MFDRAKLKTLMEKHPTTGDRISQASLAHSTQLSQSTIAKLLSGGIESPTLDVLERLAVYFYGNVLRISEFQDGALPQYHQPGIPPGMKLQQKKRPAARV